MSSKASAVCCIVLAAVVCVTALCLSRRAEDRQTSPDRSDRPTIESRMHHGPMAAVRATG